MPDNHKTIHQITRVSKDVEDPFVQQIGEQFEAYLNKRGYQPNTAHDYARTLHHKDIEPFMQKTFGCRSVYWLTDDSLLVVVLESFRFKGSLEGRVKNATMRYREFLDEDNRRDKFETLALSIERELYFKKYLLARGVKDHAVLNYVSILKTSRIADTMLKSFGCPTVFGLNNPQSVKQAMVLFSSASVNNHNQFRSACNKYCDWIVDAEGGYEEDSENRMTENARNQVCSLKREQTGSLQNMAMTDLFANSDYNALNDEILSLKQELRKVQNERDTAVEGLNKAQTKIDEYEKAILEKKIVNHEELVAEIFCEIAQRYMACNVRKRTDQRTLIKNSLHDIMSQLKMFDCIPHDLQKCINNFDDEVTPTIPQVIVQGDYVLQKHVDNQVDHVAKGGTGVNFK